MASNGPHRPHQRVILPNDMWVNIYEDGTIMVTGYGCNIEVYGLRDGAVYLRPNQPEQHISPVERADDLVCIPLKARNKLLKGYSETKAV